MMSSEATSSPVSASTLAYLMRWPVLRLIWLKLTFSVSEVAGNSATGQVTSERRKKPFQLARGAMVYSNTTGHSRRYYHSGPIGQRWSRLICSAMVNDAVWRERKGNGMAVDLLNIKGLNELDQS